MLITGASSGIGKATAIKAASHGYRLVLTARRKELLDEVVATSGEDNAISVSADATSYSELEKVFNAAKESFGSIDAVFANAGTGLDTPGTEDGDPKEWDKLVDINIKALLYTAKLAMPYLKKSKGHFFITASVAGRIFMKGSIYGASKWFAYGFGQNLAKEMQEWGGRCTTICPGMVNTDFFDEEKPDKLDPMDVADAVIYALKSPQRNTIREVMLMPTN